MLRKIFLLLLFTSAAVTAQIYPDQFYSYENEGLTARIESMSGMQVSSDGKSIMLEEGIKEGYTIFKADTSEYPFDKGLPSWNGHVPSENSSFKVQMRFYKNGWSNWLTVGYWKNNIWYSYGSTSFGDGRINVDYAELNSYNTNWQFKVLMKRYSTSDSSSTLHKLSFFVSDQKTTDSIDLLSIINDKPAEIYIDTDHFHQYSLDNEIGGDICSPTSVSMVLRSYNIDIDPAQFARDNYDNYWGMFGIWPKAVQNAAEHGLEGAVTRYRTWSEARDVLADGGRIVMSVGPPLYTGHLMMLAGFNSNGEPLVHDPAKSNGKKYKFNKTDLSKSWFEKGGISYTFYLEDSNSVTTIDDYQEPILSANYDLNIYPNPFNPAANIIYSAVERGYTEISVYDILGREIKNIYTGVIEPGKHKFTWDASGMPSGMYLIRTTSGNYIKTVKALLVK